MNPPPFLQGSAKKYQDRNFNRSAMKIQPGEFYVTGEDEVIVTVLGSCVAACLMDPVTLVGGMNHFMLPMDPSLEERDVFYAARYGVGAMEYLINAALHLGAQRNRLVAKIFGGGKVMHGHSDVGAKNIAFVQNFLDQENIPLWAEDVGGLHPRKVYFFPHTGQVLVKKLVSRNNETIYDRETRYIRSLRETPPTGDVELFT